MDRTYVHNPGKKRQQTQASQPAQQQGWMYDPGQWDGNQWQQQQQRQRTPSRSASNHSQRSQGAKTPRGRGRGKGGGKNFNKGKDKGKEFPPFAPLPPPQVPWPGYNMMVPMGPMGMAAPIMPTAQIPPPPVGQPPPGSMNPGQPVLPAMPTPPSAPVSSHTQEERELLDMMKNRQMELPADMRQKVQNHAKKQGARVTKDLHSAVAQQGRARQDLEDAMQARLNLVASWKTFLTGAIKTWQEYAALFEQQQKEVQERIQTAQEAFTLANQQLEESQSAAGKLKTIEIKDDEEEMVLGQASSANASAKITDSFKILSCSLQELQAQTETIETEVAKSTKRPRLEPVEDVDQNMDEGKVPTAKASGPPFTTAGCA